MARPKGSKNKPKTQADEADDDASENGLGHNGGPPELTDDQMQALFFQHLGKVRGLKTKIASLSGELRAAYKLAKSEIGEDARAMLADALLLETDKGQEKMEEAIARQARVALWMATPLGAQSDMFGDVMPAVDRARAAGKVARLKGEPLHPPHAPGVPQHDAWISGWHEGEKELIAAQRRDDAVLFDADEIADAAGDGIRDAIGDAQATFTETAAL